MRRGTELVLALALGAVVCFTYLRFLLGGTHWWLLPFGLSWSGAVAMMLLHPTLRKSTRG